MHGTHSVTKVRASRDQRTQRRLPRVHEWLFCGSCRACVRDVQRMPPGNSRVSIRNCAPSGPVSVLLDLLSFAGPAGAGIISSGTADRMHESTVYCRTISGAPAALRASPGTLYRSLRNETGPYINTSGGHRDESEQWTNAGLQQAGGGLYRGSGRPGRRPGDYPVSGSLPDTQRGHLCPCCRIG